MDGASLRAEGEGAQVAADVSDPLFVVADEKIPGKQEGNLGVQGG